MKYNFKVTTSLTGDEESEIVSSVAEGLEATASVSLLIGLDLNTELSPERQTALVAKVQAFVANKFGEAATAELISIEH